MYIKLVCHGAFKDALPKGHKRHSIIYASKLSEIYAYLMQFAALKDLLSRSSFELRVGKSIKTSRSLHPDELRNLQFPEGTTLHLMPHVSGHEITTAMIITALISAAASIAASFLVSLLFPPEKNSKTDEGRRGVLYQGGLVTQKENVPKPYIAGLDVACGGNLIEGDVTYLSGGGITSINDAIYNGSGINNPKYGDGLNDLANIYGSKGGGGSGGKTLNNTIVTDATMAGLLAIGDGPIGGIVGSTTAEKEANIYINEWPLRDPSTGELAYQGTAWEERSGEEGQTPIAIVPGVANNVEANVALPYATSGGGHVIHEVLVTNENATRARVRLLVKNLLLTDDKGNQQQTGIAWSIDVKRTSDSTWSPAGSYSYTGKSSDPFVLEKIISAPPKDVANTKWQFRIQRLTPDSSDDKLRNETAFNGHVELQDIELNYDGSDSGSPTALFGIRLDMSQFDEGGSYPQIMLRCVGRKVRVPTNYDPVTRVYTGTWDGSWKTAATQNPVWHWLHIATDEVQGLGIPLSYFNRFELYQISKFNDENLNGRPRYTLNKQFSEEKDGWPFLVELATSFRAFPYFNGSQVVLVQDRPQAAPDHYVNNTMVEGGFFNYSATEVGQQFNEVLVDFLDPKDFFRVKTVRYRDTDSIARNKAAGMAAGGVIRQKYEKIGCTNEQEAYDFARMLTYVSQNENEFVTFKTMIGAAAYAPGQIIAVDDHLAANKKFHGRVAEVNGQGVQLDQTWTQKANTAYDAYLVINNVLDIRPIAQVTTDTTHTFVSCSTADVEAECPLGIVETNGVQPRWYRIQDIKDEGEGQFSVTGKLHVEGKHEWIENNVPVPEIIYSEFQRSPNLPAPIGLTVTSSYRQDDLRGSVRNLHLNWARNFDPVYAIRRYHVEVLKPDGQWHEIYDGMNNVVTVEDVSPGKYLFSVTPINTFGKSGEVASIEYELGFGDDDDALLPPEFAGFD